MRDEPPPHDHDPYAGAEPERGAAQPAPAPEDAGLPQDVEAEQALLGAILVDATAYDRVSGFLTPEHFYDPVHARVYRAIASRVERAENVDVNLLKPLLSDDEGLKELGGAAYLGRLASAAIAPRAAKDYARAIVQAARRRSLLEAADAFRAKVAAAARDEDVDEALAEFDGTSITSREAAGRRSHEASFLGAATAAIDEMNSAYQGHSPALETGLPGLDSLVPIRAGNLVILAGRPSMGKTGLAGSMALRFAGAGHPARFHSGEMMREELAMRMLSEITAEREAGIVPYNRIMDGALEMDEFRTIVESAREYERLPLAIDDGPLALGRILSSTRAWLRRVRAVTDALPVVFVDYLQIVQGADPRAKTIDRVSQTSAAFKALAKEEGIAVVALAQLSRQVESREDKRPMLSDLRESGQIEQDADKVLFVYRDEYYLERARPPEGKSEAIMAWQDQMDRSRGVVEVICAKQRQGRVGAVKLRSNLSVNRFWEDDRP